MKGWKDISLYQYQQIERINARKDLDELGKTLLAVCVLFDMTEYELDKKGAKVADKLGRQVAKIFNASLGEPEPCKNIGNYLINYDPDDLRTRQYVELMFFMQGEPMLSAHYILASISNKKYSINNSGEHKTKSTYFQSQPILKVVGTVKQFTENFAAFNAEFKPLFGLDDEVVGDKAKIDPFNKRFGWTYAVTRVAEYERVTLDQAYELPSRQFLNDLAYLKALDKYMAEQSKQK